MLRCENFKCADDELKNMQFSFFNQHTCTSAHLLIDLTLLNFGQPQPLWKIPHEERASVLSNPNNISLFFNISHCVNR